MTPWRELHQRYPHATQVDVDRYAAELDAIDEALGRAEQWTPGPMEDVTRVELRDTEGQPAEMFLLKPPVVPVRVADAARLAVALLQRGAWEYAGAWDPSDDRLGRDQPVADLPSALTLLRRKLNPAPAVVADLLNVAIMPAPNDEQHESDGPAMYLVQTLVERVCGPKPPPVVRASLRRFLDRIRQMRDRERGWQRELKKRMSTKRLDGLIARVNKLLGTEASE